MQERPINHSDIPIVVSAFGTTAKAFSTYGKMDAVFRQAFPDNPIHWAYSSRMVKYALKNNKSRDLKDPGEVIKDLSEQGCPWAVLQSLHLIPGHELHRLVAGHYPSSLRLSLGLPLLSSPEDFMATARALEPVIPPDEEEAVVVVGHGTDHPSWTSYFALETLMRRVYGPRIFSGVMEGFPDMEETLGRIMKKGYKKARIIPLLLVAGVHFIEDLTREEDSWQRTFEKNGIPVTVVSHGVGELEGISKVFCDHMAEALDVIPL